MTALGFTDIRKNQQQVDAAGNLVGTNRPDVSGRDPSGKRVNVEFDTTARGCQTHQGQLSKDPNATNVFVMIDPSTGANTSAVGLTPQLAATLPSIT